MGSDDDDELGLDDENTKASSKDSAPPTSPTLELAREGEHESEIALTGQEDSDE